MEEERYKEHLDASPMFTYEQVKKDAEMLEANQPHIYSQKKEKKSIWGYVVAAAAGVALGFALKSAVGLKGGNNLPGSGWPR